MIFFFAKEIPRWTIFLAVDVLIFWPLPMGFIRVYITPVTQSHVISRLKQRVDDLQKSKITLEKLELHSPGYI